MLSNFNEVLEHAKKCESKRLVVADAAGKSVIEALRQAAEMGIITPILVGDESKIKPLTEEIGLENARFVNKILPEEIAATCVELIRDGDGDMIMKGKLSTPILMKAILNKETGLRKGKLLSHVAAVEVDGYPKILLVTDGGIVLNPDLGMKMSIIINALEVANGLGIETPKVACLAAIEKLDEKQPETFHAAQLSKMAERGQLGAVTVNGPVAMDVLLSHDAAKAKGLVTDITLDADILLVPDVPTGNALVKALIYLADAKVGGLVMGASCPIVLLSRSDTAEIKLCSIALACIVC